MTFVGHFGGPLGTMVDFSGHLGGPWRTVGDFCRSLGVSLEDNGCLL